MNVPKSKVFTAHDKPYMIISRYDRALVAGSEFSYIRRLHQEDFCQSLKYFPRQKYEKEGGPGWRQSFELMNRTSDPVRARSELLSRALGQFLWYNPDAHAKNYAILYGRARMSLSPLYDLNNGAAFRAFFKAQRPRVAMFVGGERDPTNIGLEQWAMFARDIDMWPEDVLNRLYEMAEAMPAAVAKLREEFKGTPGDTDLLDLVVADIEERCGNVLSWREQPKRAFA
jgi:serine/threonine-protein kinase HipA